MRNIINEITDNNRLPNSMICKSSREHRFEFGLGYELIYSDMVEKAKMYGLIVGQSGCLSQIYGAKK